MNYSKELFLNYSKIIIHVQKELFMNYSVFFFIMKRFNLGWHVPNKTPLVAPLVSYRVSTKQFVEVLTVEKLR